MIKLNQILKESKLMIVYHLFTRKFILVDLKRHKIDEYANRAHLLENLNFKLSTKYKKDISYDKNAINENVIKLNDISYLPSSKIIITKDTQKILNINFSKEFNNNLSIGLKDWQGLEGKFPTILKILVNLCEKDKNALKWALKWFSHIVKYNLGIVKEKVNTSILFYGCQGSGKNLFINGVMEMFVKTKELSQKDLENTFNYYLISSNLITFNEIKVNKNSNVMDEIKNMITCNNHSINIKSVPQYEIPNIHNYIFTSNKSIPLIIESDDRRFTILNPKEPIKKILCEKELNELDKCFKNPTSKNKYYNELINFGNYLINYEDSTISINAPFDNETKRILTTKGFSLNEKFIYDLQNKDFKELCDENDLDYKKYFVGYKDGIYYSRKNLIFKLYEDYYNMLTKKTEFIRRKDLILDELIEKGIFIPLRTRKKRINLINEEGTENFNYLYIYCGNSGLYLDERPLEVEEVKI